MQRHKDCGAVGSQGILLNTDNTVAMVRELVNGVTGFNECSWKSGNIAQHRQYSSHRKRTC